MGDLVDDYGWMLSDTAMATPAEIKTYVAQYSGIDSRISAGTTEGERNILMGTQKARVSELHSAANALYSSNRTRHDALLDIAWAINRLP
jgi:hypothetical protein